MLVMCSLRLCTPSPGVKGRRRECLAIHNAEYDSVGLPDIISHAWVKIVKRTGIKHFRFHDGRHIHASLLPKQNVHPKVVQERLGHATTSTTLDLYSHVAPGLQEAAAARFDEAFAPTLKNDHAVELG